MKVVGIVVEYNPLHNGHLLHLEKIKQEANPDLIIAVMSSSFTSRGDLSIFDKFEKTKQALMAGIDLVIELPLIYTLQRADIFAKNAIDILNLVGVDEIWIGSEENNIELYKEAFKKYKGGFDLSGGKSLKSASIDLLPFASNDLLGFFYYKRIIDMNYDIKLYTIKREITNFLDLVLHNEFIASSNAIRNNISMIDDYTPSFVSQDKKNILSEDNLYKYVKYKIISTSEDELKKIFLVDEGLEYKIKKELKNSNDPNEFISLMISKRYTKTRIKRMLCYILLNITKEDINSLCVKNADMVRILGFNDNGKKYLNKIKKNVKVISNIKEGISPIYDIELKVSKILDLIYDLNLYEKEKQKPVELEI